MPHINQMLIGNAQNIIVNILDRFFDSSLLRVEQFLNCSDLSQQRLSRQHRRIWVWFYGITGLISHYVIPAVLKLGSQPAHEQEDQENDDNQSEAARGIPTETVVPWADAGRTDDGEDEKNRQD
jgi:hypothetical protein